MPATPPATVERTIQPDRVTGVTVARLTDHKCHSHHFYFTNPGWWDCGRRLLIGSDRGNRTNLYSIHLPDGAITQLTDSDMPTAPRETSFLFASVNPTRDEAYYWRGPELLAIDLHRAEERTLWRCPDGFAVNLTNVTADGRYVCTGIYEQLEGSEDLLRGYIGFGAYFDAHPLSRVMRIDTETGEAECLHEERNWIGHVNTSPTRPNLLTFCHEGPWNRVRQRIWGLDLAAGDVWPIRPQNTDDEMVGHEYWLADGETIGYHGHIGAEHHFYGFTRYDNTETIEADFNDGSHHFHSNTRDLIVGDGPQRGRGSKYVLRWRFDGERFSPPRVLCEHRCSRHIQILHVHPRFSPDGSQVLFTSDMTGYGQVHLADVPPFEALPKLDDLPG